MTESDPHATFFATSPSKKSREPAADQLLRFAHDPIDQFLHRRNVVDQAGDHAAAPGAGIHIAVDHDLGIDARDLVVDVVDLQLGALLALDLEQMVDGGVLQHPLGIADRAHDQPRVEFGGRHQRLLDVVVDRRLLGGHEARAHVHALRAHRQRGNQTARIGHAARGHERDLQLIRGARQQDHVRDVVLAGMTAAFETVDADGVAADRLGLERVTHRGAFVDHLDAGGLQRRHVLFGAAAGGFDRLDAAFPDRGDIFRIGRRGECRQEGQVHAERLVGHVTALGDFLGEQFRRALRQAGDDAEPTGIGDRGSELGEADIMHAALDDRVLDAKQFGDRGLHRNSLPLPLLFHAAFRRRPCASARARARSARCAFLARSRCVQRPPLPPLPGEPYSPTRKKQALSRACTSPSPASTLPANEP